MFKKPLQLFNSMGRALQEFKSIEPGVVKMYSCGPTVYNYAHIGNLRAYIFTDFLRRVLNTKGYDVLHVINITDVGHLTSDADEGQDKMELTASKQQKSVWEIAEYYTDAFKTDLKSLNIKEPSIWARATDHIQEMIDFARRLEDNGYAYPLDEGLYFDTSKVADYGKLGLLDLDALQEGARVAVTEGKRNSADFAVWRRSPGDKQRLMEWHSPWQTGAPGWHLECSVMSLKYLGRSIDIHTGGIDHRQVHHCNEIAQNQGFLQSESSGVNYWLHNEFLTMGAEKMSKSRGEFLRLQSIIDRGYHPLVYRYFILSATYRAHLEFTWEALSSAHNGLQRLVKRIARLKEECKNLEWLDILGEDHYSRGASYDYILENLTQNIDDAGESYLTRMDEAISNDLNSPKLLATIADIVQDDALPAETALRLIAVCDLILGLNLLSLTGDELMLRPKEAALSDEEIEQLIEERKAARAAKDFKRSDEIRDELAAKGVTLKDGADGTSWEWVVSE